MSVRSIQSESVLGLCLGLGHPDLMEALLGLRARLRQIVEDVAGLVHPAALRPGLRIHLRQRRPEAQRAVADGQLRRPVKPRCFIPSNTSRQLCGLPNTVLDRQEVLLAAGVHANHHQYAQPFARAPQAAVDAVRVGKAPPAGPVLLVPTALEPAHDVRRQPASASSPTSADTAARIRPVDTPCRYSHGTAASRLALRRT